MATSVPSPLRASKPFSFERTTAIPMPGWVTSAATKPGNSLAMSSSVMRSFQLVKFTVKNGGADVEKPATTNTGQQMSNANSTANAPASNANSNANAAPTPEGKDMPASQGGAVDAKKPLLTYSRPKGEYKGADADPIMIDFWLTNAKLVGDGGEYRVRYTVGNGQPQFIDKWAPLWLTGWTAGKHAIKLELVDKSGNVVDNGGYNSTTREITVVK